MSAVVQEEMRLDPFCGVVLASAGVLLASVGPAAAEEPADIVVERRMPRPNAFFIINRAPLPEVTVERLPAHLRVSWARARRATRRLRARQRARVAATRPLERRWAAIEAAPDERQAGLRRALRAEQERVAHEFADVEGLAQLEQRLLRAALVQARRSSVEHGLGQLALAELELACAQLDFAVAFEDYERRLEAGEDPPEPPEAPNVAGVLAPAQRAAERLEGRWRGAALYLHAFVSLELGDEATAARQLERLLALPAGRLHGEAALRLGELAFEELRWAAAASHYRRALGSTEHQAIATYKLAWAELRAGRWAEARDAAAEFVEDEHELGNEARRELLPRALAHMGDHEGASLPAAMSEVRRASVLLALAELLFDVVGDVEASRGALESAAAHGADVEALTSLRGRLARSQVDGRGDERWVRTTLWHCASGSGPLGFSATARRSGGSLGYVGVEGGGEVTACLLSRFGTSARRGPTLHVDVRAAR